MTSLSGCQYGAPTLFDPINRTLARRHIDRAEQRRAAGDIAGAENAFHEAVRHDRRNADAHGKLGDLLMGTGDIEGAVASYARAVKADPNDFDHALALADALFMQASTSSDCVMTCAVALRAYQNARSLRDDDRAALGLARCHNRRGEHEDARNLLLPLVSTGVGGAGVELELAEAYLGLRDSDQALVIFHSVLKEDDENAAAHFGCARACLKKCCGLIFGVDVIAVDPGPSRDDPVTKLQRERARAHLRRVIELDPSHVQARLALRQLDCTQSVATSGDDEDQP